MNGLRIINAMLGEPIYRKRGEANLCRDLELASVSEEIVSAFREAAEKALRESVFDGVE